MSAPLPASGTAGGAPRSSSADLEALRHGRRREGLADDAQHLRTPPLGDRNQATELEPDELDRPDHPHRAKPEVRQEVAREDRLVHPEALVLRLALRVAVGERLERLRALVPSLADRGQEQCLQHPRARTVEEVRTGDEDRVVGRRPRRQLVRARKQLGRPVLHRADDAPVVFVVERAPGTEVPLGAIDPAVLVGPAARLRLPPHTAVADDRRLLKAQPRQALDACRHRGGPTASMTTLTAAGRAPAIRSRYSSTRCWTSRPTSRIELPQSTSR